MDAAFALDGMLGRCNWAFRCIGEQAFPTQHHDTALLLERLTTGEVGGGIFWVGTEILRNLAYKAGSRTEWVVLYSSDLC